MKKDNNEIIKLNWQDLTEENITKLYLYGDLNKTHDLTSKEIHREGSSNDANSTQITIELNNFYDYMTNDESPMRYANLSQVPVVQKFFNEPVNTLKQSEYPDIPSTPEMVHNFDALTAGTYSIDEVRTHFNDQGHPFGMQHMNMDPLSEDYDKRVYVLNSQAIHLGNEAQFIVKPNGERLIENAAPTVASEDFDFVTKEPDKFLSKETLTNAGNNFYLKPNMDPLGIGRTVDISYPRGAKEPGKDGNYENAPEYTQYIQDYSKAHGDYTKEKFENDLQRYEQEYSPVKGLANVAPAMSRVVDNLWESNTTKFVDTEGNAVIYEKDTFEHTTYANNFNMQTYMQENKDVKYHLIEENGTESFIDIPRDKEKVETVVDEKLNDYGLTEEDMEWLTVSNEEVEQIAKENERPITTYLNDMKDQMANQDQNDSGRSFADDYAGMD